MENRDMPAIPTQSNGGDLYGGLTKREYFANSAMNAVISNANFTEWAGSSSLKESPAEYAARQAVSAADALIEELDK